MKPLNLSLNSIAGIFFWCNGVIIITEALIVSSLNASSVTILMLSLLALLLIVLGFIVFFFKVKIGSEEK